MYHLSQHHAPALPAAPDETFRVLMEIPAVVLIYGNSRRLFADEHNHAGRLMRTLDKIGREGIELRGAICGRTCLDRSSVRALNLYLRHGRCLQAFRRASVRHSYTHRFAWAELQALLNLRWVY